MIRRFANVAAAAGNLIAAADRALSNGRRIMSRGHGAKRATGETTFRDALEQQYARIRIEECLLDGGMVDFADRAAWWERARASLGEPPRDALERGDWHLIEASLAGWLVA